MKESSRSCSVVFRLRLRVSLQGFPGTAPEQTDAEWALCISRLMFSLLQFRYKRRVYTQALLDDKQFAKLHTKVRLELSL